MNFCPNCGTKITNPDDQFCMSCGQRLVQQAEPAFPQDTAEAAQAPVADAPAQAAYDAPAQAMPAAQEADLLGLIDDGLAQSGADAFAEAKPTEAATTGGFFSEEAAPAVQADAPDLFVQHAAAETPADGFFGEAAPPEQPAGADAFAEAEPFAEEAPAPIQMDELEQADLDSVEVDPSAWSETAQAAAEPEVTPELPGEAPYEADPADPAQEMPVQHMPQAADGPSLFEMDDAQIDDLAAAAAPETEVALEQAEAAFADATAAAMPEAEGDVETLTQETPAGEAPAEEALAEETLAGETLPEEAPAFAEEAPAEADEAPAAEEAFAPVAEAVADETAIPAEEAAHPLEGDLFEAPVPAEAFAETAAPAEAFADATPAETAAPSAGMFGDEVAAEVPAAADSFFGGQEAPAQQPVGGFFAEVPPDAPAADENFFAQPPADDAAPAADSLFSQAAPAQPMATEELFRESGSPQPYVQQYPTQEPVQQRYTAPEQSYDLEQSYEAQQAKQPHPGQLYAERYNDNAGDKGRASAKGGKDGGRGKRNDPQREAALDAARADLQKELYGEDPRVAKRNAPPPVNLPPERERRRSSSGGGGRSTGSRVLTFVLVVLLFIVLTLGVAFVMLYLNNRASKTVDDFMEAVAAADAEEIEGLATVSGTSPTDETWDAFCAAFESTASANALRAQLLLIAGDDTTDIDAMPYPAVNIESRPFLLFIQKYTITISGVELLVPGAADGTYVQLNGTPYQGTFTEGGMLYQNLMPGLYECRVGTSEEALAAATPVEVTLFEVNEPNLLEGAAVKATITIENCASDDATLYINDLPVEDKPSGGMVTLADVSVGSVIRIVAQVDGAAMQASVTFDNPDVTTLRFDNYTPADEGGEPPEDSSQEETEAYKFAASLTAGEINSTLTTFYASYLKAINDQDVERIDLATASAKTSMESRITSSANASNLFEFVSADVNTSTIEPADEGGTSVVRLEATFKYKYRPRPEEGAEDNGEVTDGSNVQNVELVYQDGKWLVSKMERKEG